MGPCLPDPVPHPQKPESVLGWGGRPQNPVLDVTGDLDMFSDFVDLRPRPRRRGRRSNQARHTNMKNHMAISANDQNYNFLCEALLGVAPDGF